MEYLSHPPAPRPRAAGRAQTEAARGRRRCVAVSTVCICAPLPVYVRRSLCSGARLPHSAQARGGGDATKIKSDVLPLVAPYVPADPLGNPPDQQPAQPHNPYSPSTPRPPPHRRDLAAASCPRLLEHAADAHSAATTGHRSVTVPTGRVNSLRFKTSKVLNKFRHSASGPRGPRVSACAAPPRWADFRRHASVKGAATSTQSTASHAQPIGVEQVGADSCAQLLAGWLGCHFEGSTSESSAKL